MTTAFKDKGGIAVSEGVSLDPSIAPATGFINGSVATGISAAGANLAAATALTAAINVVSTAAASTGVALPSNTPIGGTVTVQNLGANDLEVYPHASGANINGAAAGGAITLAAATDVVGVFTRTAALTWIGYVVAGPAT